MICLLVKIRDVDEAKQGTKYYELEKNGFKMPTITFQQKIENKRKCLRLR